MTHIFDLNIIFPAVIFIWIAGLVVFYSGKEQFNKLLGNIFFILGFTLLVAFMYRSFLGIKFFISWWAFIFPLAAMTIASLLMYKITNDTAVLYLSYTMIISTTIIILVVIYQTIKNMLNHEVCIQE